MRTTSRPSPNFCPLFFPYSIHRKDHDPTFTTEEDNEVPHDSLEWYQLHLATERIKIPEILFQVRNLFPEIRFMWRANTFLFSLALYSWPCPGWNRGNSQFRSFPDSGRGDAAKARRQRLRNRKYGQNSRVQAEGGSGNP